MTMTREEAIAACRKALEYGRGSDEVEEIIAALSPPSVALPDGDAKQLLQRLAEVEREPVPYEGIGDSVSAVRVIKEFCGLQAKVARHFNCVEPCDCFCGDSKIHALGEGTFDSGYRNTLAAFKFIERATLSRLKSERDAPSPSEAKPTEAE